MRKELCSTRLTELASYNEKLLLSEAGIFEVPRKDALFTKILNERKWHRRKVQLLGKLTNLAVTDGTFYLYTPAATRKSLQILEPMDAGMARELLYPISFCTNDIDLSFEIFMEYTVILSIHHGFPPPSSRLLRHN